MKRLLAVLIAGGFASIAFAQSAPAEQGLEPGAAAIGTEAIPRGPDEFRALLAEQREAFGAVIRQLGIRPE